MPSVKLAKISFPSVSDAAEMGIREWPQQTKSGSWEGLSKDGDILVRYVLDGKGTLKIEENGKQTWSKLQPGTLIEVKGEALLSWTAASAEMIILTPTFEEGGVFFAVAAIVTMTFIALLALS